MSFALQNTSCHKPGVAKKDVTKVSPSTALGILGMTGYAAYAGLLNVATIKAGETVTRWAAWSSR